MVLNIILLVFSYLLGSIPFSIIIGKKYKGIDVRKHGSGNPGGTNSMRWLGRKMGLVIIFLDALKAGLIVLLMQVGVFDQLAENMGTTLFHPLAFGVAAAYGHVFSVFIKFKGGKAVAASVGVMTAFNPVYAILNLIIFFIVLRIWKYVSVASCVGVFSSVVIGIFIEALWRGRGWDMVIYTLMLFVLVLFRHRSNFVNIKHGTESKVKIFDKKQNTNQ